MKNKIYLYNIVTNSTLTSNDFVINFTILQLYDLTSSIISLYLYITLLLHNYYSRYIALCKSFMSIFDIIIIIQ